MTSIEWLWDLSLRKELMAEDFEQAKEMHKQEIIDAYVQCGKDNFDHIKVINTSATQYYEETYGSKGSSEAELPQQQISINELKNICQSVIDNTPSDATEKEIGYTKAMEHIIKIIGGEPHKYSQQEISDEEIEIAAANLANPNADKTDNWIEGAKWYREQLKQKQ
jgi:hypothetical protein